ncbi:MAG: rhodanese-like domain-containing protein [Egibacteraceae bacterium]
MIEDLTPRQVAERLRGPAPPVLVDVRERWEFETAAIIGAHHLPLGELPNRFGEVPRDRPVVLHCHHGARSMQAACWLEAHGYTQLANLAGGIDAWSRDVDPGIPRYS